MAINHLSAIGFPVSSEDDFNNLVSEMLKREAQIWKTPNGGKYARIDDSSSGAELWFYLDPEDNVVGINPHFHGFSRMRSKIWEKEPSEFSEFEGGYFHCWAVPRSDDDSEFPYIFSSPDYLWNTVELEKEYDVQLAGFPHEVMCYDSLDDFMNNRESDLNLAPKAFIPIGSFIPKKDRENVHPDPTALLTGTIKSINERKNQFTGTTFLVVRTETLCGELDIVLLREWLNKDPLVGGVLEGTFWLSGKIWADKNGVRD